MEGVMPQKPVKKIKLGEIQASIWVHENGQRRKRFTVAVTRRYQNKDGNWVDSEFFDHSDLPVVSKAMDFAYGWIWKRQLADEKKSNGDA